MFICILRVCMVQISESESSSLILEQKRKISEISLKKAIEIHFNRLKIFLLYSYNAYDVNLRERNFGRNTAFSCRTNVFIEFYYVMKKEQTQLIATQAKHF